METGNLLYQAGKNALELIKDGGLSEQNIQVMAAAAGGPKWLVLRHLDTAIFTEFFRERTSPLYVVGASSGAWRLAAASQKDMANAAANLEREYINQIYLTKPTAKEVSRVSRHIVDSYIDRKGVDDILNHPFIRLSIMTAKSLPLVASENKLLQSGGLAAAFLSNAVNRKYLKYYFHRALFYDSRDKPPFFNMNDFPINKIPLSRENFKAALLASGSIPLVMSGVTGIKNAPRGVYRDGGVIDYHPDMPFLKDPLKIVLYPHYSDRIIPGWFDKKIPWRSHTKTYMENVLMVSPSPQFIERLPFRKIPDRNDFYLFKGKDQERISYWKTVAEKTKILGQEFLDVVLSGKIKNMVRQV